MSRSEWGEDLKREMKNPYFAFRFYYEMTKLSLVIWLWKISQRLMGVGDDNHFGR